MPSRRRFLAAVGATAAAGLAGCIGTDGSTYSPGTDAESEWPMPAYDRGFTAYNPDAAAPRDGVTERWSTDVPHPTARPVVAAGTVLVPTSSALVALDVDSGEERWRLDEHQPWVGAPAVHDGTAYVGSADRRGLVALDVEAGDRQWHVETVGAIEAAPTFGHDHDPLYVGDDTGRVYQVDPTSGEVTLGGEVFGPVTALAHHHLTLLVGTGSGEVYEIYADGEELAALWRRKVAGMVTALATRGDEIYVGTFGGPAYRLHGGARTGASQWEAERGGMHLAAASRDVVGSDGAGLRTLDHRTGDARWERGGRYGAGPAVAGDTVYVGGGPKGENGHGFVAAYALSGGAGLGPLRVGGERWRFDVETAVVEGVAVADGAVFAVTQGFGGPPSRVYALDPA